VDYKPVAKNPATNCITQATKNPATNTTQATKSPAAN